MEVSEFFDEAHLQREVEQNFKRNFLTNALEMGFYFTAMSFVSSNTILPAFVMHFTASSLIIGMIPFLAAVARLMPQIFAAKYGQKLERKKSFVLYGSLGERVPWLILAISLYFFVDMPSVMIVLFLLLYSLISFASGLINPVWLDMLAKIIPERRRGMLFGLGFTIGKGLGILGSLAAGCILDHYGSIKGFTLCFFFAFLFNCVSWICMALIKEPRCLAKKEMQNITTYLYQLPNILQKNRNFSLFLLARMLSSFYGMAAAFFTVYAISRFNATNLDLGIFTALLSGSGLATNFFWGYLGDKKGHKIVLVLACLLGVFSIPTAVFASSLTIYYIVFAIYGMVISANMISGMSIILEFAEHEDRSTYVALNNLVISPVSGTASLLGGFLANSYNYPIIFLMTIPILILGLTLMLLVKDPRSMHPE